MSYLTTLPRTETLGMRMAREGYIIHPQRGRIPFRSYDYQRTFWNDTSMRRIVLKARQIGMSQAVGAEAVDRALKGLSTILLISRNEDQAIQLLNYCKTIYANLDHPEHALAQENTRRMTFANGSVILSLPANRSTGRGFAASHVYIDEAAFIMWADLIYQSIAPSIAQGGTLTILSSPDGPDNLFGRIWEGKLGSVRDFDGRPAPGGVWSRHFIPYDRCPTYTPQWVAENKSNYTEEQWQSEFLASLAGSGERVFKEEALDQMIVGWLEEQEPEVVYGDLWYLPPQQGRYYVTGWDLGRKNDPTVGITHDVTSEIHQLVAFERFHQMPWDEQQERITARYRLYPGWHAIDATGVGDPMYEALTLGGYNIIPFIFSRVTKPNLVDELVRSTEFGILKHGIATLYDEMHRYRRKDDKLVQDCVMALGIAENTARHLPLEQTYEDNDRVEDVSRWMHHL